MNVDVSNEVIVITGASKGSGGELAKVFAAERVIVVMNYCNSKTEVVNIFTEVIKVSPSSLLIRADVRNPSDVSAKYHEVIRKIGHIDVLEHFYATESFLKL